MKAARQILGSSEGFTLVEVLVSVSILTVVVGMFSAGLFQVFSIQRFWTDDIKATKTVRHAGSWFAGDALNAEKVLDAGDLPLECTPATPVEEVKLTWTDSGLKGEAWYYVRLTLEPPTFWCTHQLRVKKTGKPGIQWTWSSPIWVDRQ